MKGRLALLAAIFLVAGAQAAINGPIPFEADFLYIEGFDDVKLNVVSGKLSADLNHVAGTYGFFDAQGMAVEGLERICWAGPSTDCLDANGGALSLVVAAGGSVGMRLPMASDATYTADHVLGMFVDFEGEEDLNSFGVGQTLTAPAVNGLMTFEEIRQVPRTSFAGYNLDSKGGIVPLDETTTIELVRGGTVEERFIGKDYQFSFEGAPEIAPFGTDLVFLPFEDGSFAFFTEASGAAAREGLKLERVNDLMSALQGANQNDEGNEPEQVSAQAEEFQKVLSEVLNGAVMRIPLEGNFEERFAFLNFDDLRVAAEMDQLAWSGTAALQVQNGEVEGAPNLVGVGFFVLPWWSFMLWGMALTVWIIRLSLKTEKKHETWDRYKWIGWVFGALSFVLLFWLWDLEVRSVWGTSLFSTSATGTALAITALVQIAPLMFVLFAVAAPLRMLIKNGLMLSKQGTFMGLSTGVSYMLAYVLGATLLLAYIELILIKVLENVGG